MNVRCAKDLNSGLTLLELLVVITLMALVAATVTTRLGSSLQNAQMGQATSQWAFTDQQMRRRARHAGQPTALHLEIGSNRLECEFDPEDESSRTVRTLARGVEVSKYLSTTQEVTHGPIAVRYSGRGTSESFAVELSGGRNRRHWILVAGITGQLSEVGSEAEARQLLELLLSTGLHAR